MHMPFIRTRALSVVAAAAICLGAITARADDIGTRIAGTWVGPGLDRVSAPGGAQAYMRRTVIFTATEETLRLEAFGDEAATVRLFVYESTGPYRVLGPSSAVAGAYEVNLRNDRSLFTIHVPEAGLWRALNLGACPLELGKAVEIAGCVAGPPFNTSACTDLDLIHVDPAGALRFGDQSVDRCVTRPTTLDRAHYVRAAP